MRKWVSPSDDSVTLEAYPDAGLEANHSRGGRDHYGTALGKCRSRAKSNKPTITRKEYADHMRFDSRNPERHLKRMVGLGQPDQHRRARGGRQAVKRERVLHVTRASDPARLNVSTSLCHGQVVRRAGLRNASDGLPRALRFCWTRYVRRRVVVFG